MGIDAYSLSFLLESINAGCSLESTVTIGRQAVLAHPDAIRQALQKSGLAQATEEQCQGFIREEGGYLEPLLRFLGARRIESIDVSDYESATIVHDMNQPISPSLKDTFTCVLDSGCLEHIFNFPQAIKNCMEMVKPGGTYLGLTPGNNLMGHGFYQFSPELYYRVLSPQNGFVVNEMIVCEMDPGSPRHRVKDPEAMGHRIVLANTVPTYLFIRATKTHPAEIFATTPTQSDYTQLWTTSVKVDAPLPDHRSLLRRAMPYPLRKFLRRFRSRPSPYRVEGFERIQS